MSRLSTKTGYSDFNFLTHSKPWTPSSNSQARANKVSRNRRKDLSQSQMCRKLHSDLQEYAIRVIEAQGEEKIGTKLTLMVSQLKQSLQFQTLAIKFWMLIINLQYHDVKKLSRNISDR